MEPRNRVAKQAIPVEKNEVFLKKRRYGSGATQSPFVARTIALAKRITPVCRQATK